VSLVGERVAGGQELAEEVLVVGGALVVGGDSAHDLLQAARGDVEIVERPRGLVPLEQEVGRPRLLLDQGLLGRAGLRELVERLLQHPLDLGR
jgi:hypothetical protein